MCDAATMRSPVHPTAESLTLTSVLYALSDPVRLYIVQTLSSNGAQSCGAITLCVVKSTASHHFRVLREAGIIQMRAEGTQFINTLRIADLEYRFPGLLKAVLQASPPA
jgi:DNA-binding transcriptional ArsR family regulator